MDKIIEEKKTYLIDGKEYTEMTLPDEFKELLKDENNDGIPDGFEQTDQVKPVKKITDIKISFINPRYGIILVAALIILGFLAYFN